MAKPKKQKKDINFLSNLKYVSPSKVREHFASAKLGVGDSIVHSDGDDNVILECVIAYPDAQKSTLLEKHDSDTKTIFVDETGHSWNLACLKNVIRNLNKLNKANDTLKYYFSKR